MTSFETILDRGEPLVYKVTGRSMLPMLTEGRDLVILEKPKARLKKYDVAFYRSEGRYILHRVIRPKNGYYVIRGDNNINNEKIPEEDVLGVLTAFVQDGKKISAEDEVYVRYCRKRVRSFPIRFVIRKLRAVKRAVKARLGKKRS